jgi:GxxExxY protein
MRIPDFGGMLGAFKSSRSTAMDVHEHPEQNETAHYGGGGSATELLHGDITGEIISAFYAVYNELGFGFLESVYVRALAIELFQRRMNVAREVPVTVYYKGVTVGTYRADLVVSDTVVVEVKAGEQTTDQDRPQLINYLRASGKEVGLLLHFGPKAVLKRVIHTKKLGEMIVPVSTE